MILTGLGEFSIRGYLIDIPDQHKKVHIAISDSQKFFGFPGHMKVMFTPYCSILNEK